MTNIKTAKSILPKNVQILEDLGIASRYNGSQGWLVIEMTILGKPRKYLLNWWDGSHGEIGSSMVEIKDE